MTDFSKQIKVGSVIKLIPSIFTDTSFAIDKHYGNLGYPGLLREWLFKVVEFGKHSHHGDYVVTELINVKGAEGNPILLLRDCQPAVLKRTVEYKIIDNKLDNLSSIQLELDQLLAKRAVLEKNPKLKPTGRTLKANATAIKVKQAELDKARNPDKTQIFIPKINKTISVDTSMLSDIPALEMFVASTISDYRNALKPKLDVKTVQGVAVKKLGGVNVEPKVYSKIFEQGLATFIEQNKVPTDPTKQYLGIEIECITKCSTSELKKIFIEARLHKHVSVTTDGSINVDITGYHNAEIRILCSEDELVSIMSRVQKVLRDKRVRAETNRSCGVHVHLDQRTRDAALSYRALFNVQSLLRKSQPEARQSSSYCKPNKSAAFKVTEDRNADERYSVINTHAYKKFKTLEVRIHEGTVNCFDLIKWCQFLTGVVNNANQITKPVTSVAELRTLTSSIPETGMAYIQDRIEAFGDEEYTGTYED